MRTAILIVVSVLLASACEDILPVETVDLCEQPDPPSVECPQCSTEPFAPDCPQCKSDVPAHGCANAPSPGGADAGGSDASAGAGRGGGSGQGGGTSAGRGGNAGNSGSGGVGGMSAVEDAGPCAACPATAPLCRDGSECVQCLEHDDCTGNAAAPWCEPGSYTCVTCLEDVHCGEGQPRCYVDANACVQCLENTDCAASEPVCTEHSCGACDAEADCADQEGKLHCETDSASPRAGQCVECRGHGDCANPEPQCSDGACVPCTGNGACTGRTTTPVCNTREDAETVGQCVECTGATEAARCGDRACRQSTGVCTGVVRGTLLACAECAADSECAANLRCVDHVVGSTALGSFCFFEQGTVGCADDEEGRRPYSRPTMLTSVDLDASYYCLPSTTCEAVDDATAMGSAGGKTCTGNGDCGNAALNDGYCPASGGAMGRCSYQCDEHHDCPDTGFTLCSGSGANAFCQP